MTIPERNSEAEPRLNPQMAIELILGRQLISYLGVPMFLVDPRGDLLYYNEAHPTLGPWRGPTSVLLSMFHGNACHLVSHSTEVGMFVNQHRPTSPARPSERT